jgi:hypothetical protein
MVCMAVESDEFAAIVFILPFLRHLQVAWQIVRHCEGVIPEEAWSARPPQDQPAPAPEARHDEMETFHAEDPAPCAGQRILKEPDLLR